MGWKGDRRPGRGAAAWFLAALLLIGTVAWALAARADPAGDAPAPIRIGCVFARSGLAAEDNAANFTAARIAMDGINAEGGLLGRPVEMVAMDNLSSPLGSRIAARAMAEAGVAAVIGAAWSSHSLPMAPVLQAAGIPMITPVSSHADVTAAGDFIFRVCVTDAFQGGMAARFAANDLSARTAVVLVNVNEDYSLTLADHFIDYFTRNGGAAPWRGTYRGNAVDFADLLARAEALSPDVIFVPGYARDAGLIIRQARRMGIGTTFLGGDGWTEHITDYTGADPGEIYFFTQWHPAMAPPESGALAEEYRRRTGGPLRNASAALTHDAVMLLADAIRRAKSDAPDSIRDALAATTDFHGLAGVIRMTPGCDPMGKRMGVLGLKESGWEVIEMISTPPGFP